jgi:hypothetical protein
MISNLMPLLALGAPNGMAGTARCAYMTSFPGAYGAVGERFYLTGWQDVD